jgi:phthiocerol/phenolphthiocerol synthesis type-I polyketide synthase E
MTPKVADNQIDTAFASRTEPPISTVATDLDPEIVRKLTVIWQELLGLAPINPEQNYFDLGGDSLLAVKLFGQIEKTFNVELPLATLFDAPTIAEMARLLASRQPVSGWSSLVPIQPGGSRPKLFCLHGAGGNVLIYRELAEYLGPDQPVFGLQSRGLDGNSPPHTRIEDMAQTYVQEIRRIQPFGPYYLGGYCLGGTIAYEMAQQLQSSGQKVALLALFDTMNWSRIKPLTIWDKALHSTQRIIFHAANVLRSDAKGKIKFLREKIIATRQRIPVWRGLMAGRFQKKSAELKSKSLALGKVWEANHLASMRYVPKPFDGVITDFRPLKQYQLFKNPDLKWEQLGREGQRVFVLPVYPGGMLVEPFVRRMASVLRQAIDTAEQRSASR